MEWAILKSIPDADCRAVLSRCRRLRYTRGEAVFREGDVGDAVHLIAKGTFAIRVSTPSGDTAALDVLGTGETFGEQALINPDQQRSATVVALERAETMRLSRTDFEALLSDHPDTMRLLVSMLDARLRATSRDLVDALYLPAETRVIRRLIRLADLYRNHDSGAIPVTQDDLATMAGTTRQTVNRILRQCEEESIIRLARGRVEVLDPGTLARRAR